MNQNQAQTGTLIRSASSSSSSSAAYDSHQSQLLLREARRQGIARWLGLDNSTNPYLESKYYPQVANGTSPPTATSNETDAAPRAYKVMPFVPDTDPELAPVHALVTDLFAARAEPHHLYLQNLTGFAKGHWEPLPFTYADLGLNETWTEETRPVPPPAAAPASAPEEEEGGDGVEVAQALAEQPVLLIRRQSDTANETTSAPTTAPGSNVVVYNRTLQRGTFPWLDNSSPMSSASKRTETHHATFNLRSLQTSATGPVLRHSSGEDEDGHVLRVKDRSSINGWQEWEKLGPVVYVGGKLTLHAPSRLSPGSGEDEVTELDVEAVHFLDSGRIFGYATPEFAHARIVETISLPLKSSTSAGDPSSFASPNLTAVAIGHAMLREYDYRLERDVKRLADADEVEPPPAPPPSPGGGGEPSTGDEEEVEIVPRCIFTLYGALSPLPDSYTPSLYAEWYSNLFHPTGADIVDPPSSTLSAILASPNCGLVLSVPNAKLHPTQQLWNAATVSGAWLVAVEAVILLLQVRQLERVQDRPGTIANVSHYGIIGMLFVDAYTFVTLLTLGVVFDSRASLSLLAAAFMSLLSSLLFGTRYIAMIREATPDRAVPNAPTPAPATPSAAAGGSSEGVTLENSAMEGGAMATMPEWLRRRANGWTLRRTRKVLAVTLVGGFALYLINWHGWTAFILWVIYSNWIPQIFLNVWRGTARQSLADEYVVGMTLARIGPPLYFWAYEGNCLLVPTTPKIWYLAAYYFSQATILVLQSRLASPQHQRSRLLMRLSTVGAGGARFFLPQKVAKWLDLPTLSSWDYHPRSLPPALLADLQNTRDLESHGKEGGGGGEAAEPDCPICLTGVHVFPTKEEQAAGEQDQVRMAFAVTPCAHLVHTECLEQWVMVRSICPVCRASLPPLGG
ncbi:hypothetical protein C6P46_000453 [Rhodotorula mucilaginosa]|uniref:RING-type E3 ubiquitin transferase n=1 Tax=Rhodotorula mucilaginosa TaxID=5537 RepID=A0A9P6VWY3_RHOMI|nr:hypothetical protein C6P46_000453 [Rhodotorula mucilaginosa]